MREEGEMMGRVMYIILQLVHVAPQSSHFWWPVQGRELLPHLFWTLKKTALNPKPAGFLKVLSF
jgi:hypothetical protein